MVPADNRQWKGGIRRYPKNNREPEFGYNFLVTKAFYDLNPYYQLPD